MVYGRTDADCGSFVETCSIGVVSREKRRIHGFGTLMRNKLYKEISRVLEAVKLLN